MAYLATFTLQAKLAQVGLFGSVLDPGPFFFLFTVSTFTYMQETWFGPKMRMDALAQLKLAQRTLNKVRLKPSARFESMYESMWTAS